MQVSKALLTAHWIPLTFCQPLIAIQPTPSTPPHSWKADLSTSHTTLQTLSSQRMKRRSVRGRKGTPWHHPSTLMKTCLHEWPFPKLQSIGKQWKELLSSCLVAKLHFPSYQSETGWRGWISPLYLLCLSWGLCHRLSGKTIRVTRSYEPEEELLSGRRGSNSWFVIILRT